MQLQALGQELRREDPVPPSLPSLPSLLRPQPEASPAATWPQQAFLEDPRTTAERKRPSDTGQNYQRKMFYFQVSMEMLQTMQTEKKKTLKNFKLPF